MPSIDDYRRGSNPPSRRQSDVMPPPPNTGKITRSETSTPKATSPPTNSDLENRRPSSSQAQLPLLDSLNDFAHLISSAASLTVKRDLSKQQAVAQQKERDRQSKFKTIFLTLMEDAESRAEGAEKVTMGIEKQIDLSSQAQSKITMTLAARLQKTEVPETMPNTHDRGRCKEDFAQLKVDLQAARKKIDSLNREAIMPDDLHRKVRDLATKDELRGLVTKDELWEATRTKDKLRGLVTRDELQRVATDEVRSALVPTEKKLATLTVEDANLSQLIKGVEAVTQKNREMIEEKDRQQAPRFGHINTSLNDMQESLSRLDLMIQGQQQDYATFKDKTMLLSRAQDRALADLNTYVRHSSNNDLSLDKKVARNSNHVQLLQQDVEKLDNAVRQTQDFQAASEIASSHPVSKASMTVDTGIQEEVRLIRSELDALKPEQEDLKLIRHDLDVFKADQEKVILIRADLDSLVNEEKLKDSGIAEGFEVLENSLKKQHEDLARLQHEIRQVKQSQVSQAVPNHPPTPPFASASTSPYLSDHQKLQDVEIALKDLTKTTQGLELFVNHQQQKFDGLTSDRIVQSMIHQMQQLYPSHPGNCFDLVNQCLAGQARVDRYLSGNLKDRLVSIESQIAARVVKDSRLEEVTRSASETRNILLATVNSLKQDIDGLKGIALNKHPQDSSDYGERIDELADRVTAVEARYVKAIHDFQINQANLVRGFTQLRYQSGIDSMQNTLGELTATSRCSRSVEPNGTTISSENFNDSDTSDTPLSLRSGRGVREERRSFDPTTLKRKAADSDGEEDEAEGGEEEAKTTNSKKVPKRRNVSGMNPFS